MKQKINIVLCLFLSVLLCCSCAAFQPQFSSPSDSLIQSEILQNINEPYAVLNGNVPEFTEQEKKLGIFENYSELDYLGRCGVAFARVSKELMPKEDRESIGQVKPSGWHTVKYDIVDGKYLYNRCHLIGFQLAGENANELNLITGTRYMNVEGMLPFENEVADYVRETSNTVLYRVTPVFEGENLVANGVKMEAYSLEDNGSGVCFNVFVYNIQPGVVINYANGESYLENTPEPEKDEKAEYIININSKKVHKPTCKGVESIKEENKKKYTGTLENLEKNGYEPCKTCFN